MHKFVFLYFLLFLLVFSYLNVRVDAEDSFWEELTRDEDNTCGNNCLCDKHNSLIAVEYLFQIGIEQSSHTQTIDNKHDVVAHEHGCDVHFFVSIEKANYAVDNTFFFGIDFHSNAV